MSLKVLVCDDEAPVRALFTDLLKTQKCTVSCVSSGEEAVERIEKEDFDVIILDIKLPGISGIETLKNIKDKKPNVTVLMITGFGYDEELISKSRELGCAGYIGKNMPISQIISNFNLFVSAARNKAK